MRKNEVKTNADDFWQIAEDVVKGYETERDELDTIYTAIPDDHQYTCTITGGYLNWDVFRYYCVGPITSATDNCCCDSRT